MNGIGANGAAEKYRLVRREHDTKLIDLPADAKYFFSIRDPVSRFVSAFYERKNKPSNWTSHERRAFERFSDANELAEALSRHSESRHEAFAAVNSIAHTSMHQRDWFDRSGAFLAVRPPVHVLRVEHLETDFKALLTKLNLDPKFALLDGRTRRGEYPVEMQLGSEAVANLKAWYWQDVLLYEMRCEWLAWQSTT